MPKVIIIYHTVYGNTRMAADVIAEGVKEAGLQVELGDVRDVKPEYVVPFDVIMIGSPTHRGDMSQEVKGFVTGLKKLDLSGKKGGAFDTRYVSEETGALAAIESSMKEVGIDVIIQGLPVGVEGAQGPIAEGELSKCKEFGRAIAEKLKRSQS